MKSHMAEMGMRTFYPEKPAFEEAYNPKANLLKKFAQLKLEEKPVDTLDPYKLDDGILLIPDRWTKGGWKYTTKEPVSSPFFNMPNRVNG